MKTTLQVGLQLIKAIKNVHESGFLHRDLKPANITIGIGRRTNSVRLIDFGLAKNYKGFTLEEHIPPEKVNQLIGTQAYASINSHKCIELSRRDDLESLMYILIDLHLDWLPWLKLRESQSD